MEGIEGEERRYRCGRDEGSEELTVRLQTLPSLGLSLIILSSLPSTHYTAQGLDHRRYRKETVSEEMGHSFRFSIPSRLSLPITSLLFLVCHLSAVGSSLRLNEEEIFPRILELC